MRCAALLLLVFLKVSMLAQKDSLAPKKEKFDRKEEIIYDNKRYRIYNNYFTLGGGYLVSSIRSDMSKSVGFDMHFHIRRQYFQLGGNISGVEFLSNNNTQAHFGWGKRFERNTSNIAFYGGVSYYYGVRTYQDSALGLIPLYYDGWGLYLSAQAVKKFMYDIGVGVEAFVEISQYQNSAGIKFILFFSGAYMGPKKNYNPHVRSENRK